VITGFNTDIDFEGKTYHVQTEDKGLARPIILSLVYDRGTILASKRVPYNDLLAGELDEEELADRLRKQHRTICAAIKAGRLDELMRMTESARKGEVEVAGAGTVGIPRPAAMSIDENFDSSREYKVDSVPPIPKPPIRDLNSDVLSLEPLIEDYAIIDEEIIVPDEAVEIVSEMVGRERPANNKLTVEMLGESRFRGGEHKSVTFMVCRGSQRKVVGEAQIMVKILGSSFRPLIFHARSDQNGIAKINLQFPNFSEGRAALLVRAMSEGEEVELRRVVANG
jgi:hypothetical protein